MAGLGVSQHEIVALRKEKEKEMYHKYKITNRENGYQIWPLAIWKSKVLGYCPSVLSRIFLVILLIVKQGGQNLSTLINTQTCMLAFSLAQACLEKFEGQMPLLMVLNSGSQIHTSELPVHNWTEALSAGSWKCRL